MKITFHNLALLSSLIQRKEVGNKKKINGSGIWLMRSGSRAFDKEYADLMEYIPVRAVVKSGWSSGGSLVPFMIAATPWREHRTPEHSCKSLKEQAYLNRQQNSPELTQWARNVLFHTTILRTTFHWLAKSTWELMYQFSETFNRFKR